jgi:folate-binding protein YgfZ
VRGEDALSFLQGQFSQDLRPKIVAAQASYGLWLNHKGRVLADSFALVAGSAEVWLISYFSAAAGIREWLESHVVADDVTIEDHTAAWCGRAFGGAEGTEWLRQTTGEGPPAAGQFARVGHGFIFRGRRSSEENWEWLTPAVAPPPACNTLAIFSAASLEQLRLAAGVPAVPLDLGPSDLPQEGGIETVALSYTKGCYVGQEVMARLRTGKIRRRLMRVCSPGRMPERLAPLFQQDKKDGELRSMVGDGNGGWLGLAMLTLLGLNPNAPLKLAPGAPAEITLWSPT